MAASGDRLRASAFGASILLAAHRLRVAASVSAPVHIVFGTDKIETSYGGRMHARNYANIEQQQQSQLAQLPPRIDRFCECVSPSCAAEKFTAKIHKSKLFELLAFRALVCLDKYLRMCMRNINSIAASMPKNMCAVCVSVSARE